ncbi:MAG: pyrroline-5-carboxylate reductase [Clostridiaceae bacterium]|nr:pyrroline-5-carboxylate reductase [Clostridiaceae bacterium]
MRTISEINVGVIGTGKMGSAIIKGMVKSGTIPPWKINVFDVDRDKTLELQKEAGITVLDSNEQVMEESNVIILAVVPSVIKPVLEQCGHMLEEKILVSIAAGVPISTYKGILGNDARIVRAMPNRPAMVFEGITLISYQRDEINNEEIDIVKNLFRSVGRVEVLDESLMDEVVALTSSSPAYVFMMIESMADATVLSGIPRKIAYTMAAQAVLGSAKMVLETGKHPAELKDEICTPAGTTIEAVKSLEKSCFRYAIMEAMCKCTEKAKIIGEKYK